MKKWYKSRTLWFALLFGLVSIAGLFGYADFTPSGDVSEIVNICVAVIVLILRAKTNKGITL